MPTFSEDGLTFQYPESWDLERQETENGWTVSVQSPGTAFILVSFDAGMPPLEDMADSALAALKEEYKEIESDEVIESLAGQPAVGHDVRFFSLDLTNSCWIRSFYNGQGSVLVLWQVNDLDLDDSDLVLKAILHSMMVEEE